MRRFRPLFLLFVLGCAAPEKLRAYREPNFPPADRDLHQNLRSERSWEEQEQMLSEVRSALGNGSNADSTGPKR
ncbi:MAG: hypothetical protein EXS09_15745 [Gemmataceae bacterium]|nr:hypothetical protein [Gemmataceae bacterium]